LHKHISEADTTYKYKFASWPWQTVK
jgi:hypothetical protein